MIIIHEDTLHELHMKLKETNEHKCSFYTEQGKRMRYASIYKVNYDLIDSLGLGYGMCWDEEDVEEIYIVGFDTAEPAKGKRMFRKIDEMFTETLESAVRHAFSKLYNIEDEASNFECNIKEPSAELFTAISEFLSK